MLFEPFDFSDVTAVTLARSDRSERGLTLAEIKHSGFSSLSTVVTFRCILINSHFTRKPLQRKVGTFSQAFSRKWKDPLYRQHTDNE